MATAATPAASPPRSAPITSIQPGRGPVMKLELAWGRLRRACLRRFRPGYVRQMQAKRQGDCPSCPHDVIDPRDLKFYRNVCGYWFRPEDDRFRWRDRLGLARVGLAEVVLANLLLGTVGLAFLAAGFWLHGTLWLPLVPLALLWVEAVTFFRDPVRSIPADPSLLLSPADGTVTDVGEVDEPDFPGGRAFRVGIFLSIFNVHINRIPRTGRVVHLRYFPGLFLDARHPDAGPLNEQLWIDLEEGNPARPVRVKQISGKLARRIVCWLKAGEAVKAGDKLGMIKFGSRTELLIPTGESIEVLVKPGDKVKGASTALLRFKQ